MNDIRGAASDIGLTLLEFKRIVSQYKKAKENLVLLKKK